MFKKFTTVCVVYSILAFGVSFLLDNEISVYLVGIAFFAMLLCTSICDGTTDGKLGRCMVLFCIIGRFFACTGLVQFDAIFYGLSVLTLIILGWRAINFMNRVARRDVDDYL